MMKKNYIHIYLLGILLLSVACTGKFREFNTDQSGICGNDYNSDGKCISGFNGRNLPY